MFHRWKFKNFALRSNHGSVSIVVLCMCVVLLSVACTLTTFGQIYVQVRNTESAADLAALAGAQRVIDGEEAACANARLVASFNYTELMTCTSDASGVLIVVGQEVQNARIRRIFPIVTATARAGY